MPLDYNEFAEKIKQKYPAYKNVDNYELATKMVEKYPEYKNQVVLKKKEPTVSGSKSERPTSVSSTKGAKTTGFGATQSELDKAQENKNKTTSRVSSGVSTGLSSLGASLTKKSKEVIKEETFTNFPGKGGKDYRFHNGQWYEYGSDVSEKKGDVSKLKSPIKDPMRVQALNKQFNKSGTTEPGVFLGYPGKEKNEYRVVGDNWQIRTPENKTWINVTNQNSVTALNNYFKKDVKFDANTEKVNQLKQDNTYNVAFAQNLKSINSSLIDKEEEEVVKILSQKFPASNGWKFEETGAGDRIRIQAPNGQTKIFSLDNWTWDDDKTVANDMYGWMERNNLDPSAYKEEVDKKYKEKAYDEFTTPQNIYGEDIAGEALKAKLKGTPEENLPSWIKDYDKKSKELYVDAAEARNKSLINKAQVAEDIASKYAKYINDPSLVGKYERERAQAALGALAEDKSTLNDINQYQNDIKKNKESYKKQEEEAKNYLLTQRDKYFNGEITKEEFEAEVKLKEKELTDKITEIKNQTKVSDKLISSANRAVAENYFVQERQGSLGGNLTLSFLKGLGMPIRLLAGATGNSMTAKEYHEAIKEALSPIWNYQTTMEYQQSANRSDFEKSAASVAESVGAMVAFGATGGSGAITESLLARGATPLIARGTAGAVAFYPMSYYEMKDELDGIEGISEAEKVFMSSTYGLVSSAFESIGMEYAMGRISSPMSTSIKRNILKRVLGKTIPKDAPKEYIDALVRNETKAYLASILPNLAGTAFVEGGTESLQSLMGAGIKESYDIAKGKNLFNNEGFQGVMKDALYEGYLGMLGGGMVSSVVTSSDAIQRGRALNSNELGLLMMAAKTNGMDEALMVNLKADLLSGRMTKNQAKEIANNFQMVKGNINQMPENLTPEAQSVSLSLMMERDRLNKQIEGKDPNLVKPQADRVAEINTRLQEISKENAVQEQSTGEVPVQSETGVSQQMEEGVPGSETEGVTGEVVGEETKGEQAKAEVAQQEEAIKIGSIIKWNVYGNEEQGDWNVVNKTETRGGQPAVELSKLYVESISNGKTYTKEYADKNGIKYENEPFTVTHIVPLSEFSITQEATKEGKQEETKQKTKAEIGGIIRGYESISEQDNVGDVRSQLPNQNQGTLVVEGKDGNQYAVAFSRKGGDGKNIFEQGVTTPRPGYISASVKIEENATPEQVQAAQQEAQRNLDVILPTVVGGSINAQAINDVMAQQAPAVQAETVTAPETVTTEVAPSTEAELDFEVTPEVTQEADALEKLLADEGITIEAPVVEQPVAEEPVVEEAVVEEIPSQPISEMPLTNKDLQSLSQDKINGIYESLPKETREKYFPKGVDGIKPTRFVSNLKSALGEVKAIKAIRQEATPVSEVVTEEAPAAEAKPTAKPKAAKKLTVKEVVQKYNDHIDSLIKAEKEKSDRRIAQLANQRNSATGQRRTELTQEIQDLEFAFKAKKRGLESKKDDKQAAKDFNENPARFRMSEGTQEEADTRNDEQAIIDKMNEASAEEKGLNRGEVPADVEVNPIEESSSLSKALDKVLKFLGLKDKNSLLKKIEDFNGIPMILGMSDILAAGTIKDSMGGDMVVDGGLLYNTLGKNVGLAWAGVTEDGANNQVKQARELYEANKELFDRLWAEGKIPKGHVPMAIMRMGNTAINSNEAVFRYLLPLVKSLPLKNRTAALRTYMQTLQSKAEGNAASYWFTELEEQIETGNLTSKEQVLEYLKNLADQENKKNGESTKYKKIIAFTNSIKKNKAKGEEKTFDDIREELTKRLDKIVPFMLSTYIKSNKIKTLDGFLEAVVDESKKRAQGDKNIFSLPVRAFIFNSLISPESTKGANELEVIKTLLDGVKNADATIFTAKHIYDAIGEKSMLRANKGDVVGIMGIKVVDENGNPAGGAKKAEHNNYGYGPEGKIIALIKNPKPGIDVFPEFRAKLARVFKPSKTGKYPTIENAVSQTGGAFFMDAAFRGTAPAVDAMTDLKILIGKLRFAFPEVSVATTQEEFDNFLEQEGIRAREKDGKVIYGVTKDGRIFLNPSEQTLRTPIHEFGHIWIDYLRSKESGKKGDMLLQKGFELVDGTPEYERALKEYGSRELALEEALVELMAVKGDTIANAAKKSQFLEWMNAMFKYIKENMIRSKDFAQSKIKDLTLDEFINIGLADLFSGQRVSGKFDARTAGEGSRARFSKADNISKIIDIAAKNGVSNEAVKLLLARQGFSISDINAALVKKAAPIKKGKVSKVTVNEKTALKDQIRLEARAAREAKKDVNDKRKDLAKTISDMETTGKITTKQAQALMARISKLNMDNPAKVDAFVEYAGRVFENAEFAQDVARANSLKSKVKNNAKTKLGIANDLISEILVMASINPSLIPSKVFNTYLETMEMLGQRTAVLKLDERGELTQKVSDILNAVNEELSVAGEMSERFEAYDKKEVDSEGKIDFAKTLDKMLADDTITKEEADIMRKYKSDIIEKESTKMTDEELEAEKKSLVSILQKETISDEAIDNLPSRLERDLAKAIKALIKTDAVKSLNNTTLKNMLKLVDNINNGFVPHYAQSMKERLNGINNSFLIEESVKKASPLKISSLVSKIKSFIKRGKNSYENEMIRSVSLGNVDQTLGDFKTENVSKALFNAARKGISAFNSKLGLINDKLEKAKAEVSKSFSNDPNSVTMSAFKTMTYLLQLEKDSNPGSKQVNNSVDIINATIAQIKKGKSIYTKNDGELLNEILDEYTNKKALEEKNGKPYNSFTAEQKSELKLDNKKLYNSFNSAEKAAIKTIQDVNSSMTEMAVYTAGIIRGDKINPIANYVPHIVIQDKTTANEITGASDIDSFNKSRMPSTKAKNLVERTGAVTPINFNPYKSTQNAAKNVLLDFHMTEPIRTARITINETRKRMEENGMNEKEVEFLNAIEKGFEEATENVLSNSFYNDGDIINKAVDVVSRAGYQAVLGTSLTRTASELLSNMTAVGFMSPMAFINGVKNFKEFSNPEDALAIMLNVGATETERVVGGNTQGGMLIDPSIMKNVVGMEDTKAKSKLMSYIQMIYNESEVKEGINFTKSLSDILMSAPDKIVTLPTWFGAFANEFEKVAGKKVDFKKIKDNDEAYINENAEAIEKAKEKADKTIYNLSGSNNAYNAILKNQISPDVRGLSRTIKVFNNYLTRFTTIEYLNARTAVYALAGKGMISKRQAAGLLAGVTTRMITYSLLTKVLSETLLGLMGVGDDDDDDKTFGQKLGQALASSATTLILGRNFGNITRNIMAYGVEEVNKKYLTGLREGEYDPYQDAIQYTVVPQEKKGDMGKGVDTEQFLYNLLGPLSPFVKSITYGIKKYTEDDRVAPKESDSDAVKKKRMEAVTRQQRERTERVPLEVMGTLGLVPLYKDVKKAVNESIYADLKKSLKEQEANKKKKEEMLMGYESKEDMELNNPKLYKALYERGGKYYAEEEIRLANENLKSQLKDIEKKMKSGDISPMYARNLEKAARRKSEVRKKKANR